MSRAITIPGVSCTGIDEHKRTVTPGATTGRAVTGHGPTPFDRVRPVVSRVPVPARTDEAAPTLTAPVRACAVDGSDGDDPGHAVASEGRCP